MISQRHNKCNKKYWKESLERIRKEILRNRNNFLIKSQSKKLIQVINFKRLEEDYKKYKMLWEREALGNKLLLDNLKVIDTFANTTVETNGILLNSNRLLSERCVKILSAADFFYTFYLKYLSLLSLKNVKRNKSVKELYETKGEIIENNKEVNVSILEEEMQRDF